MLRPSDESGARFSRSPFATPSRVTRDSSTPGAGPSRLPYVATGSGLRTAALRSTPAGSSRSSTPNYLPPRYRSVSVHRASSASGHDSHFAAEEEEHRLARRRSVNQLTSAWDQLLEKYGSIGLGEDDEIDLRSERVVVDRGRLKGLKRGNDGLLTLSDDEDETSPRRRGGSQGSRAGSVNNGKGKGRQVTVEPLVEPGSISDGHSSDHDELAAWDDRLDTDRFLTPSDQTTPEEEDVLRHHMHLHRTESFREGSYDFESFERAEAERKEWDTDDVEQLGYQNRLEVSDGDDDEDDEAEEEEDGSDVDEAEIVIDPREHGTRVYNESSDLFDPEEAEVSEDELEAEDEDATRKTPAPRRTRSESTSVTSDSFHVSTGAFPVQSLRLIVPPKPIRTVRRNRIVSPQTSDDSTAKFPALHDLFTPPPQSRPPVDGSSATLQELFSPPPVPTSVSSTTGGKTIVPPSQPVDQRGGPLPKPRRGRPPKVKPPPSAASAESPLGTYRADLYPSEISTSGSVPAVSTSPDASRATPRRDFTPRQATPYLYPVFPAFPTPEYDPESLAPPDDPNYYFPKLHRLNPKTLRFCRMCRIAANPDRERYSWWCKGRTNGKYCRFAQELREDLTPVKDRYVGCGRGNGRSRSRSVSVAVSMSKRQSKQGPRTPKSVVRRGASMSQQKSRKPVTREPLASDSDTSEDDDDDDQDGMTVSARTTQARGDRPSSSGELSASSPAAIARSLLAAAHSMPVQPPSLSYLSPPSTTSGSPLKRKRIILRISRSPIVAMAMSEDGSTRRDLPPSSPPEPYLETSSPAISPDHPPIRPGASQNLQHKSASISDFRQISTSQAHFPAAAHSGINYGSGWRDGIIAGQNPRTSTSLVTQSLSRPRLHSILRQTPSEREPSSGPSKRARFSMQARSPTRAESSDTLIYPSGDEYYTYDSSSPIRPLGLSSRVQARAQSLLSSSSPIGADWREMTVRANDIGMNLGPHHSGRLPTGLLKALTPRYAVEQVSSAAGHNSTPTLGSSTRRPASEPELPHTALPQDGASRAYLLPTPPRSTASDSSSDSRATGSPVQVSQSGGTTSNAGLMLPPPVPARRDQLASSSLPTPTPSLSPSVETRSVSVETVCTPVRREDVLPAASRADLLAVDTDEEPLGASREGEKQGNRSQAIEEVESTAEVVFDRRIPSHLVGLIEKARRNAEANSPQRPTTSEPRPRTRSRTQSSVQSRSRSKSVSTTPSRPAVLRSQSMAPTSFATEQAAPWSALTPRKLPSRKERRLARYASTVPDGAGMEWGMDEDVDEEVARMGRAGSVMLPVPQATCV